MPLRRFPSPTPPPASLAVLLGIVAAEGDEARTLPRLAQVAASWPFAALVQGVAVALACLSYPGSVMPLALASAIAVAAVAVMLIARIVPAGWQPHHRVRAMTAVAAVLAAALLGLLGTATHAPAGALQSAAMVTLAGAIGMAGLAVHPVRAAILGFGVGLVATMGLMVGPSLVLVEALALLLALGIATWRLARHDHAATLAQAGQLGEGQQASKMIAEFEVHGTGWFWEADRHGRVTYLSAKVAAELAEHDAPPIGRLLTDIFRMDGAVPGTERTLAFHLSSRTSFSDYSVCAAGDRDGGCWWSISGRPVIDDLGRFQGFIGSGSDLTEKRKSEAEITRLALYDGLTGLANRQRMRLSLDKTLAQGAGRHRPFALFLMDLDRFKAVNDTLGHQAGDALLKQVAQRLQRGVGEAGLVGRLGGDEFQVLLPGMDARDPLATLATELINSLSQPYFIAGASVTIGCSIGIAIAPHDGEDAETLIRNADLALYAAKADGRGVHRFYHGDMLLGVRNRQQLEDDLRAALALGDFHLCYQPVVSTLDARIVGYEALVRWQHPMRGLVSPADFIPVAEECGLIEGLGEWVLRTACAEAARWPHNVRVAVNVSPIQFANPHLPAIVTSALAQSGLLPDRLELEITEGVFLTESDNSERMFRALKNIGVRLALDDFGTGYSSLGYLRTAPFDKIKIDQSFVRGAAEPGNRNAAIIRAIVTLADTLGMETTAEGVEIQDEIDLVRDLGCSHIQGYVYGRPAPAIEVATALGLDPHASPMGFKVSRAPRTRLLRSARIMVQGRPGDVRIRDISTTGAMIDGVLLGSDPVGSDVLIELIENQMTAASVRWVEGGRAGLRFAEPIDLSFLTFPRQTRRAG